MEGLAAVPGLRGLPAEMKDVEIAASVRYALRLFLRYAYEEAEDPAADWPQHLRERTARHAQEGLPLAALLELVQRGAEKGATGPPYCRG